MSARRTAQRQEGQPWEPEEAGLRTCQSHRLLPRPASRAAPAAPPRNPPRRREPMGAGGRGLGCQSPGGPAGRAHRLAPRASRACAPRASVVPRWGGGAAGAAGVRAGQRPTFSLGSRPHPGVRVEHFAPSPGGRWAKGNPARTARRPPGHPRPATAWARRPGLGATGRGGGEGPGRRSACAHGAVTTQKP